MALIICMTVTTRAQTDSGKVRVIMIGAHPDDCDEDGGTAALYAKMGYAVMFLSVTNGDAGHQTMKGKELAKRRYEEAQLAGKRLNYLRCPRQSRWPADADTGCKIADHKKDPGMECRCRYRTPAK